MKNTRKSKVQQATTLREVYTVRWLRKEWQLSLLCWGGGGGGVPLSPANYQGGSLNPKQGVPTLGGEICSFILKVSILLEQIETNEDKERNNKDNNEEKEDDNNETKDDDNEKEDVNEDKVMKVLII